MVMFRLSFTVSVTVTPIESFVGLLFCGHLAKVRLGWAVAFQEDRGQGTGKAAFQILLSSTW